MEHRPLAIFRIHPSPFRRLIIQLARSEIFNDSFDRKSLTIRSFRYVTKNQRRKKRKEVSETLNAVMATLASSYKGKSDWKKRSKILLYFSEKKGEGKEKSNFVNEKSRKIVIVVNIDTTRIHRRSWNDI